MDFNSDRIENQYKDSKDLYKYLMDHGEVSYASYIDNVYKKVLLLSSASYFENQISQILLNFANKVGKSDRRLAILVENKVIQRQYHTFFNWDLNNTNAFWGLFGEEEKERAKKKINESDDLKEAESAFLKLGKHRNMLVHKNFAEYDVNFTVDEIYSDYRKACNFIKFIFDEFNQ